jgi:fatty-acyl-CoA synthase
VAAKARAAALSAQGVGVGQRVAIVSRSDLRLVEALFACFWIGAIPCLYDAQTPKKLLEEQLSGLGAALLWDLAGIAPDTAIPVLGDVSSPVGPSGATPTSPVFMAAREPALILPTSGSEGVPKLCKVSLGRLILGGHGFGRLLLGLDRESTIYCPLPLTHATALMGGLFASLVCGCSLYLPERFSASRFWDDVARAQATHALYVGEMLRFVLAKARLPRSSTITRWVGNGLDRATWLRLSEALPQWKIVEFYGATELSALIVNLGGKAGAMGRVPFRAWSRFRVARRKAVLAGSDSEAWIECNSGDSGELLIEIPRHRFPLLGAFEGYVKREHEDKALLRDVFRKGDFYYRSFDIVYFDADDYFYFVDRAADLFRHRGHNVSTSWVARHLRECRGISECVVVPVGADDSPHRLGVAFVVKGEGFTLPDLEACLRELPSYARPEVVAFTSEIASTETFKFRRSSYRRGGDLARLTDGPLYVWENGLARVELEQWPLVCRRLLATDNPSAPASPD